LDKEGLQKYTSEIVAEHFTLLGRKNDFEEWIPDKYVADRL